jgi:hypothetical protein
VSYLVRVVEDGSLPNKHHWAIGQWEGGDHSGDTVALIEESALTPRILCQCWVAAQSLLRNDSSAIIAPRRPSRSPLT